MGNYDRATKSMRKTNYVDTPQASCSTNDRCITFVTRFVNIVLRNTGISDSNDKTLSDNVQLKTYAAITINVKDLKTLETMSDNKNINFNEIDRILSSMFRQIKNETSSFSFRALDSNNELYRQIIDLLYLLTIILTVTILFFMSLKYLKKIITMKSIILVIIVLAFFSTWYTMYKKAEISRKIHMDKMPDYCYSNTKNWLGFSWFRKNDIEECKKFNEAIHLDPLYSIAITEVFAEMASKIIMKPLECLGSSIYIFNNAALKDLPWWTQVIMIPIIIIIVIKMLFLSCALLVGRGLSMKSMFGMGDMSVGSESRNMNAGNNTFKQSCDVCTTARPNSTALPEFDQQKLNININLFNPETTNYSGIGTTSKPRISVKDKIKINYPDKSESLMNRSENNDMEVKSLTFKKRPRKMSL
ncbi:uncharacterized protein LOC126844303 isoform X2 [Adelges cooleyi]|nr:uncharacterized protein LOC126844303 isoform X2 [Adelges cooleyi]